MIKLKRFSICVLAMLALLCFVCGASIKNVKAEESPSPKVYASDISVRQGSYAYAYIKAENFVSVGSLELFVYYDSNMFSVNGQSVTGIIKNEMVSTNVATVGEAELFMASATGVNGSGNIWQITFKVNSDAPIGVYPITIAIGEANAMDFSPITIETQNFYIDVKEKAQSIKTTRFVSTTPSAIAQGESASVSYYVSGNSNNFASAEFEINYDSELLSLDNVCFGTVLTNLNGAITSVNDSVKGCVKISFAALSGVSSYIYSSNPLFTLTFRALKNVENEVAEIMMDASALYDINFNAIDGNSVVTSVSFIYDEPEIILPKIYLESYNGYDKNFVLNIVAEKETAIAAGDFIVTYDPTKLSCLSVDKQIDSSTIVSNVKKDENGIEVGQIKFSFICSGGISQQTALVSFSFLPLGVGTFDVNLSGSGIINGSYQSVAVDCVGGKAIVGHEIVTCVSQAPTCTEKGWKEYVTCKNCDYSTYEELSATGHDYNSVVTAPTCTDKGYTTYTCHCGDSYIDNYVNELGHTEGKVVVENNLLPNCTNEGCYDNVIYCTVCKEELSRETIVVDALGHTEVIDKAVAPTCTTTGLTEGKHCSVCNAVLVAQQVVNALGHDYNSVVTAPTCTDKGYTTYTCHCGDSYIDDYVNALGHTEVIDKAVAPTCTDTGLTEGKHCNVCNTVLVAQQVVNALGHDYESVVTAPTCTDKGYTTYTCHCGDSYIDNYVNALGHTEVIDKAVAPTCTDTGLTEGKHCNVCNTVLVAQQVVNALGHDYESVVTAPTCTDKGYTTYTCHCGNSYIDNYVNELGHTESKVVVENNLLPDCINEGCYDNVIYCTVCKEELSRETIVVDALGHTEVIDKAVAPTCTTTGLTEGKHCSVCNTVLVAQQVVNALGHEYGGWTSNGNNTHVKTCNNNSSHKIIEKCSGGMATCTEKAVCEICGEKYGELLEHEYSSDWKHDENYHYHECSCGDKSNISEHAWDEGIISREPTIEHEGERIYTCVDCGRTKTEQIPKKEKPATSGCASVTTGGSGGGAFGDGFTVALVTMGGAAILLIVRRKKQKYNKT